MTGDDDNRIWQVLLLYATGRSISTSIGSTLCVYVYVILCVFDGCSLRDEVANRLVRVVTSIGEVVQYDPSLITDGLSEMMQIIFASDFIGQQLSQIGSFRKKISFGPVS